MSRDTSSLCFVGLEKWPVFCMNTVTKNRSYDSFQELLPQTMALYQQGPCSSTGREGFPDHPPLLKIRSVVTDLIQFVWMDNSSQLCQISQANSDDGDEIVHIYWFAQKKLDLFIKYFYLNYKSLIENWLIYKNVNSLLNFQCCKTMKKYQWSIVFYCCI